MPSTTTASERPPQPADLVGAWTLISASATDDLGHRDETPFGHGATGSLIYTGDGRISVVGGIPEKIQAAAAAGKAQGARVCPTARPPVARATLDEDERVGRLGIAATAELVLTVDGRVEATRSWLDSEPIRVAQAWSVDAQITPVGTEREDGSATRVAFAADVARRAAAQVERAVAPEDEVVLLVLAEGKSGDEKIRNKELRKWQSRRQRSSSPPLHAARTRRPAKPFMW